MKTKKLIEINLPILGQHGGVIGTYSQRFNTRSEMMRKIMTLELDGFKFADVTEEYIELVEVPDEDNLQ